MSRGRLSARAWRRINGWLVIFWLALDPVAQLTGWILSITFVAHLSLVALALANLAAWRADAPPDPEDSEP